MAHDDDPLGRTAELGGMVVCPADRGGNVVDTTIYLLKLLERNSQNRMAFEYLMAIYLGRGNLAAAIESSRIAAVAVWSPRPDSA